MNGQTNKIFYMTNFQFSDHQKESEIDGEIDEQTTIYWMFIGK